MNTIKTSFCFITLLLGLIFSKIITSQNEILYKADSLKMAGQPILALKTIKNYKGALNAKYYQFVGRCYQMQYEIENKRQFYKLAKNNYEKCIELEPNNYLANCFLADDYYNKGLYKEAITYYKKAFLDSITFKKCGFYPTHLYGDIAIAYHYLDSINESKYYYNKTTTDNQLLCNSWYLNHWLDFNIKTNTLHDTTLFKIIKPIIGKIVFNNKSDSIETISIINFLTLRLLINFPDWVDRNDNKSEFYNFTQFSSKNDNNDLMIFIKSPTCHFQYVILYIFNNLIISKKEYEKFIDGTEYENLFTTFIAENNR